MEFNGELKDISKDWKSNKFNITFIMDNAPDECAIEKLRDNKLSVKATKFRKKRSLDANGLLWHCLGKIAIALETDKWDVYLQMLKRYGKYTYICVKPNVVESVKAQWRECEVVGEIDINGTKAVQMLCYFGSSTYNTKEMCLLINLLVELAKSLNIETKSKAEIESLLKEWDKSVNKRFK